MRETILAQLDRVLLLVDAIHVEWRIGHDEVELADDREGFLIIAVGFADRTTKPVHGEVHAGEALRFRHLFDAEDGQLLLWLLPVRPHELRRVHEHAARAAGGIENAAVIGLDDLHDEPHDAGRRIELAALLHFLHREAAHEILVNTAKGVPGDVERRERLDELAQDVVADRAIVLR